MHIEKFIRIKIGNTIRSLFRNNIDRKKLKNKNFTIISQNCIGGTIYHDLGHKFMSPTINLFFDSKDFIKFVSNIKYYIGLDLEFIESDKTYPVAKLDDITINFVHYENRIHAHKKWNERKQRINYENIFIIMTDRDGCNYETLKSFDNLEYENKVIFTHKEWPDIKSNKYIPGYENLGMVSSLVKFTGYTGLREYMKNFDYISWINKEKN
ncbi:MAG: DUF1919 domain-containing protein [Paraclostridium sordellii]